MQQWLYDQVNILLWWNIIKINSNQSLSKSVSTAPRFGTWGPIADDEHSDHHLWRPDHNFVMKHHQNYSNQSLSKSVTTAPRFGTWGPIADAITVTSLTLAITETPHSPLTHHSNPSLTHHSNPSLIHHSNHSLTHHSNHLHLPQKYKVPFARFARFRGLINNSIHIALKQKRQLSLQSSKVCGRNIPI